MAEDKAKISSAVDIFYDRTRKTVQQWVQSYIKAELQKRNGVIYYPVKKNLQDLYDSVMLDAHLTSVVNQRKSKVLGEDYAIVDENGNIDDVQTKFLSKNWFNKVLEATIDAKLYGYNLVEIQDLVNNEIVDIKLIPRGNVIPEVRSIVKHPYNVSAASLIKIDDRSDSDYYVLIDSGNLGILNQVVSLILQARVVRNYWGTFATQFGMPAQILKSDNQDQAQKYFADMLNFVENRQMIIRKDEEYQIIASSGNDPHAIYGELIKMNNAEVSKAIVGQTMTTEDGSSYSQAYVHQDVANELAEADRVWVSYVMNDILFPKLINLGYKLQGKQFKFLAKEKRTYTEKLDTLSNLAIAGYYPTGEDLKTYLDLPIEIPDSVFPNSADADASASLSGRQLAASLTESLKKVEAQKKSPHEALNVPKYPSEKNSNDSIPSLNEITALYDNDAHAGHGHDIVAAVDTDVDDLNRELESVIDDIINDVYFNKNANLLSQEYTKLVADRILAAVYSEMSFDGDFENPDFTSQDIEFFKAIEQKVYYFAAGKSKAISKSFNELLLDESGNVKSLSAFKKDAKAQGLIFNVDHLKTEYQTAISSAQSVSDWRSYQDDDVLEFSATMDGRTRPEHARLNGLQLKKTDPLWNSLMPPLGWGCRCRLLVVPNGKATKLTTTERKEYRSIPDKDFRFNPGKTGDLFPKNHPYIKALSKADKNTIDGMLN